MNSGPKISASGHPRVSFCYVSPGVFLTRIGPVISHGLSWCCGVDPEARVVLGIFFCGLYWGKPPDRVAFPYISGTFQEEVFVWGASFFLICFIFSDLLENLLILIFFHLFFAVPRNGPTSNSSFPTIPLPLSHPYSVSNRFGSIFSPRSHLREAGLKHIGLDFRSW